jgi:hypothetical protein
MRGGKRGKGGVIYFGKTKDMEIDLNKADTNKDSKVSKTKQLGRDKVLKRIISVSSFCYFDA